MTTGAPIRISFARPTAVILSEVGRAFGRTLGARKVTKKIERKVSALRSGGAFENSPGWSPRERGPHGQVFVRGVGERTGTLGMRALSRLRPVGPAEFPPGFSRERNLRKPAFVFSWSKATRHMFLLASLAAAATLYGQLPTPEPSVVLDRAVAVVNKHVILASDLDDEIRISILDPNTVPRVEITRQQALEQLISRALIEQQIRQQDIEAIEPSPEEVNARLHEIRAELPICVRQNCASDAGWKAFLAAHGLTAERVEAYLRYRLEILRFIEQRFRQGIQISPQQIETYYHDTLLPQYAPGETVPPLDQVAPRIQEILLQQQVSELFDNWLTDLRRQGDVEVLDPELAAQPAPAPAPQPAPAAETPARPGGAERGSP